MRQKKNPLDKNVCWQEVLPVVPLILEILSMVIIHVLFLRRYAGTIPTLSDFVMKLVHRRSNSRFSLENYHIVKQDFFLKKIIVIKLSAFVNLIPVAEPCSSTARIGPNHCRHRTRVVFSSDKHWHTVLA